MSVTATGAMAGAAIGSVVPGVGTLVGGAVGGAAGLIADVGLWFLQDSANQKANRQNYDLAMLQRQDTLEQNKINNAFNQQQFALANKRFGWEQDVTRRNQDRNDRLDSYGMRNDGRESLQQQLNKNTVMKQNMLNALNQRVQMGRV